MNITNRSKHKHVPPPPPGDPPATLPTLGLKLKASSCESPVGDLRGPRRRAKKDEKVQATAQIVQPLNPPWLCICSWHSTPSWLRDNEHIVGGYRAPVRNKRQAFLSIFRLHNETMNIWTHLVGLLLFIGLTMYFIMAVGMVKLPSPSWHTLVELDNSLALREALLHPRRQLEGVKVKLSHSIGVELQRFVNVSAVKEEMVHDLELVALLVQRLQRVLAPEVLAARWPFYTFLAGATGGRHTVPALLHRLAHPALCLPAALQLYLAVRLRGDCGPHCNVVGADHLLQLPVHASLAHVLSGGGECAGLGLLLGVDVGALPDAGVPALPRCAVRGAGPVGGGAAGPPAAVHVAAAPTPLLTAALYEAIMGVCYLTGVLLFVIRWPERWRPGTFDLFFHRFRSDKARHRGKAF
eukprot:CAMPEP_0198231372 /NCGR_PEP_ID=MMETSP1445-20131203/115167_1 /TAXON_ID=36898 /ORGANISM="Pyramimonas sp., Strain CCMP2087" /LENGTH=409 /DNA_ID=CAMNT_0043911983 /DNA_START=324 /DNA_END=1551 /DNA_ORIENTATION=+